MEYSTNVEKLEAMKRDDIPKNIFLLALELGLFLSSLLWIPTLCPKCLFLVFNLIIIFLVGESRLTSSTSSKLDIYEEYVIQNQRPKGLLSYEGKAKEVPLVEEKKEEVMEENVVEIPLVEDKEEEEEVKVECEVLEEEEVREEKELSAEDLNRKVEAFIAMVTMQMRLEARMVVCCG